MAIPMFIGDPILINRANPLERLIFIGADQLGGDRWRVQLSRELRLPTSCLAVPMHLDVSVGQSVRMPRYGIHWDHIKKVPAITGGTLYGVSSIRFVSLACDCIELEYEFPKQ